ncbi:MAG: hypothetical protein ACOY4A_04175 [Pseudomonadota bacterium]
MNRIPASRPLALAVLGSALALGALVPAAAQDNGDRQERRWQRQAERARPSPPPAPENRQPAPAMRGNDFPRPAPIEPPAARIERPPFNPGQGVPAMRLPRGMEERQENWGELARQQMQRQQQDAQREQQRQRFEDQRVADQQRLDMLREQQRQRVEEQRMADPQRRNDGNPPAQAPRSPQDWAIQQGLEREAQARRNEQGPPGRPGWPGNRGDDRAGRIPDAERQRRIEEQRRQQAQWQRDEARRRADYDRQRDRLERERRHAQYRYQQDYWRRWMAAQARWNAYRFDYYNDPFFYTPYSYRYGFDGRWYSTNSYGADVLRQAVRDGYREGWYAGQADRYDRWRFDYRGNYAWIDGSYGYPGYYVSFDAYRYYFRQGFERGYRDGYYGRYEYGRYENGSAVILPAVLGMILAFSIIH